jgi:hypothetical protein
LLSYIALAEEKFWEEGAASVGILTNTIPFSLLEYTINILWAALFCYTISMPEKGHWRACNIFGPKYERRDGD